MRYPRFALALLTAALCSAPAGAQTSRIDPIHKYCWGENVGHFNWRDAGSPPGSQGCVASPTFLSGFIWGENVGYVNLGDGTPGSGNSAGPLYSNTDGSDSGVNIDSVSGDLFGLAWGENIGWVNFDTRASLTPYGQQARLDRPAHRFRGYAWSPNVGWINLDDASTFVSLDCPADFNCSGVVGVQDIFDFLAAYFGGCNGSSSQSPCNCHSPDINNDGVLSVEDIFGFLAAYFGGCA